MQNEQLKSYSTGYILPYGIGYSFVTVWEDIHDYRCERIVVFAKTDQTVLKHGWLTSVPKSDYNTLRSAALIPEALRDFGNNYGKSLAEADLFSILFELAEKSGKFPDGKLSNVSLHDGQAAGILLFLQKKDPSVVQWIQSNTKSDKLKGIIKLVANLRLEDDTY